MGPGFTQSALIGWNYLLLTCKLPCLKSHDNEQRPQQSQNSEKSGDCETEKKKIKTFITAFYIMKYVFVQDVQIIT